jgi:hypothetical protein
LLGVHEWRADPCCCGRVQRAQWQRVPRPSAASVACSTFCAGIAVPRAKYARGALGARARRVEAGRGPRRLAAPAPDRRSLRQTRSIGACRHKPSALTFIGTV